MYERYEKKFKEGKATFFEIDKLKSISLRTIKKLLDSFPWRDKRIIYDDKENIVGGTQKDTREFIKALIQLDKDATEELGMKTSKEQLEDYKYLKSI